MPGCDGLEFGSRIASVERFKATRLVLLVPARGIRSAEDLAKLGFAAHLLKPVSHRDLRECLNRVMSVDAAQWYERTRPNMIAANRETSLDRRILLAEDNLVNQKVARGALEKMGCRVDIVNDGAEAVSAWESGKFHLILMDCQMPVMDGYQAAREIRLREARSLPHSNHRPDGRCDEGSGQAMPRGGNGRLSDQADRSPAIERDHRAASRDGARRRHERVSLPRSLDGSGGLGTSLEHRGRRMTSSHRNWCSCSSTPAMRRCARSVTQSVAVIWRRSGAPRIPIRDRARIFARDPPARPPPGSKQLHGPARSINWPSWKSNCAARLGGPRNTCNPDKPVDARPPLGFQSSIGARMRVKDARI